MLHGMGITTGVDLDKLRAASAYICKSSSFLPARLHHIYTMKRFAWPGRVPSHRLCNATIASPHGLEGICNAPRDPVWPQPCMPRPQRRLTSRILTLVT